MNPSLDGGVAVLIIALSALASFAVVGLARRSLPDRMRHSGAVHFASAIVALALTVVISLIAATLVS